MLLDHRGEAAVAVALAMELEVVVVGVAVAVGVAVVVVVAARAIVSSAVSQVTGHHPVPTNDSGLSYFVFFR